MNNVTLEDLRQELWQGVYAHQEADARLINRIIFWGARSNEARGYRDVFTDAEIRRIADLNCVYTTWSPQDRSWLIQTLDAIYQEEEQ